MYNKKVLIDALKSLGTPSTPKQYNFNDGGAKNDPLKEAPYKQVSVRKSNVAGKGLFADEPIRAGEIIGLSHIKSFFERGGENYMKSKETPIVGKYYNHSDDAFNALSVIDGNKRYLRAIRDIQPGEEILGNYREDNDPTLESPDDFEYGGEMTPQEDGYRTYSPFQNLPYIDIDSDTIDTDNIVTDLQLVGNNGVVKNVQKNSGLQQIPGATVIREIPLEKKGGSIPRKPKKKNSKAYSRSLEATNIFFTEHELFEKPKSRKNKIYDPNSKYYREGGVPYNYNPFVSTEPEVQEQPQQFTPIRTENDPEDYDQFLNYSQTAPENRRPDENYVYGNPNDYDHYGMWEALGKPQNFNQALEMNPDWVPDEYDGSYHGFSVNPNTGVFLKSGKPGIKPGDTTWMEVAGHYMSPRADMDTPVFDPEMGRFKYVPNENYIETELTPEEIQEYAKGGYIIEELPKAQYGKTIEKGHIYTFKDRPNSYYQLGDNNQILIKNKDTGWKYVPMEDPKGTRRKALEQGLETGSTNIYRKPSPYKKNDTLEQKVDYYLGRPQDKAWETMMVNGDRDNIRHSMAGYYTGNKLLPFGPLGFIGANALGAGHELQTLYEDPRPWPVKLRESGEDVFNNFVGTLLAPLPEDAAISTVKFLSNNNLLPDGIDDPTGANAYVRRKKEGGQIPKANLGRIVKASESAFNPNLLRTINTLSKDINNAPALNFLANKYLRGIGREVQIPEILGGNNFELPGLDLGNVQSLLQRTPMLESDFLNQYGGYNPIIHELGLPIVTGGLTGHKSSFQNFDKAFRGSGMGNQNGGIYFTSQPEFASEVGRRNSLGGYGFIPNPQTFTPFVSETLFSNPDKFLDFTGPISADVAKKIGTINGVNAADYTDFNEFVHDLKNSFNPNLEEDLIQYSQRQAADALREKGFTGHIYNGDETVVYDESDLRKIKEFELYKDLDDALIMSYLQAISKNASQQSAAEAQLVKAFEEYMRTGDKSKLVNRKFGGALPKAQLGNIVKAITRSNYNPISYPIKLAGQRIARLDHVPNRTKEQIIGGLMGNIEPMYFGQAADYKNHLLFQNQPDGPLLKDVYGLGKRDLIANYFTGNDTGFTPIEYDFNNDPGLQAIIKQYGPLKAYELLSQEAHGTPLTEGNFGYNLMVNQNAMDKYGFDPSLFTRLNGYHKFNPIGNPDFLKQSYNHLFDQYGQETIPIEMQYDFSKGDPEFTMGYNPVVPIDNIAGHMAFLQRAPGQQFNFTTRDLWGFRPAAYNSKWNMNTKKRQMQTQLMDAFGKPFVLTQTNPITFRNGGALPKAQLGQVIKSLSKLTPGNAIRAGIYSSISPVGYSIVDKLKGVPFELWRNATDNGTRPFRVGMSLKHGVDELQADMLKKVGYDLAQWNKLPVKEQMDIIGSSYGKDHLERLQDVGRRRLDAWAVGLKRPQEYNTLEQIGDNTFKMVGTEYTPMYFNSLLNDLKAKQIENGNGFYTGQFSPLERLSRDQYRVKLNTLFEPAGADYELRQKDLIGYRDWDRTRQVDLEPQGLTSNHPTGTIYDNDMYGVMGGFNWKLMEHPEGMQFQTNDLWDLNPFEKRLDTQVGYNPLRQKYLDMHYYKPFQNFEVLRAVNGKPFNIQNNFLVDPKTFQTVRQWRDGGPLVETEGNPEEPVTDCPDGYIYDSDKLGCVPISNTVLDPAQEHLSNWWMNREINWPENNEDYKKKMQQILPSLNPNSPVMGQLNDWPGYVYTDDLPRPNAGGMYDTNKKKPRIFVRKSYGPEMRLQTGIHEGTTHVNAAVANDLYPMHNKIMKENLIPMNKDWSPEQKEFYSYVTAPDEDNYHSYLMNARKIFNVDPKQVVTEDDVNKWRQQAEESGMMDREGPNYNEEIYLLFKLAKNPAALTNIFNYMAENKNQSAEEVPQYTKFGGETEYELGDVVNEHTKRELEKLGYTFEQIK